MVFFRAVASFDEIAFGFPGHAFPFSEL